MDEVIRYHILWEKPHRHYIHFKAEFTVRQGNKMLFQLPAWRPGRYQLANFASNILEWKAYDTDGKKLPHCKITKDLWEVDCKGNKIITIDYKFYTDTINAGSSYFNEKLLYINPVNCIFYSPESKGLRYEIKIDLPPDFEIATSLSVENNTLFAKDYQSLMDSPFICSPDLEHHQFEQNNVLFHLWINGDHPINIDQFTDQIKAYTGSQINAFGSFPVKEYHYLFHFLPYKAYHGVEHQNSTVITLGPASDLSDFKLYKELLGVSSHELYHTWNVKAIRPKEMMPYSFERENYSRLGYVAEGVTTYFGDQFLHRSRVFDDETYFNELSNLVQRHMDNPGRRHLSVAESSFDTWLDGYQAGVPWRKVSIYNEGALCAFICDVSIMKSTNCSASLDDAMKLLYEDFAFSDDGYSATDYRNALEKVSGIDFSDIFDNLIYGTEEYLPYLKEACDFLGLMINSEESSKLYSSLWGFRCDNNGKVVAVLPDSSADEAGIWIDDQIITVNDIPFIDLIGKIGDEFREQSTLVINKNNEKHRVEIKARPDNAYRIWKVKIDPRSTPEQIGRREFWKSRKK